MSRLKDFITRCVAQGVPSMIWGPPGTGKTKQVESLFKSHNVPQHTLLASISEQTDVNGFPVQSRTTMVIEETDGTKRELPFIVFAPRDFIVQIYKKGGAIFFDELPNSRPSVQAACLRAIHQLCFGDLQLDPKRVAVVAAGNPVEMGADSQDLTPPMANRFRHYHHPEGGDSGLHAFAIEWAEGFTTYWGDPPSVGFDLMPSTVVPENHWARARAMVSGFIHHKPNMLLQFPKEQAKQGNAWPSCRTWENASRAVGDMFYQGKPLVDAAKLIAGDVGEGPTDEFINWARTMDLPDPEDIVADAIRQRKKKGSFSFKMPSRGDIAYTLIMSVTAVVTNNLTPERWIAGWDILHSVADQGAKDVGLISAKDLCVAAKGVKIQGKLPLPVQQIQPYLPILEQMGLVGKLTK